MRDVLTNKEALLAILDGKIVMSNGGGLYRYENDCIETKIGSFWRRSEYFNDHSEFMLVEPERKKTIRINLKEDARDVGCDGLRFRLCTNLYSNIERGEIVEKKTLRLLKRQSCTGCKHCGETYAYLMDTISEFETIPFEEFDEYSDFGVHVTEDEIYFYPIAKK